MMQTVILEQPHHAVATVQPWARWNLRWNPFGEPPAEDLPNLIVLDIGQVGDWLERPGHAIQLMGDSGRGKSSHLQALRGRFPCVPFVYLSEGERRMPRFQGQKLLLDEAQRLPGWRRRRLFRKLDWLALSSHDDLTADLEATGWIVRTIQVGGLTREKLDAVIERRLEWARRGPGSLPDLAPRTTADLLSRYGDDLRSILDELYETAQKSVTAAPAPGENAWPSVT